MSATTTATAARYPVPATGGELFRRTAAGVLVAVVAVFLLRAVAFALGADVGATGPTSPFAAIPIAASTVVAGAGAAVAYAALVRFTDRPVRNFAAVAAAAFVVMLVPLLTVAPAQGVTAVGQVVLFAFHVAVAAPLVAFVVGAVRL